MKHNCWRWLSPQVRTQTRPLSGPKPVMAAVPSLLPRLTPTPKRTHKRTLHPVISNTAPVTATASQRAKSPAANVWLDTKESSVKSRRPDEATWLWSWGSSSSLLYWWLLLLFLLKGADHEEECFILHPGKRDLLCFEWWPETHVARLLFISAAAAHFTDRHFASLKGQIKH